MATTALRPSRGPWLVILLAASILLNYVDRGAIGVAAPLMKDQLALSATGFGIAVSAFFWIYAPIQLLVGWLCDRICVYRLLAAGVALWALSTTLTGLVNGLTMLIVLRLMLGVGESIAFPGSSKIIACEVPPERRGSANAAMAAALAIGPAVGTLVGGTILAAFGWRAIFLAFGLFTFLWLVPWWIATRPLRATPAADRQPPYSFRRLLRLRALWAMGLGHCLSNYSFYFILAWMPLYLVKVRGYSIAEMTMLSTLGLAAQGAAALLWGWGSDRLVARGVAEGPLRKAMMALAHAAIAGAILGIATASSTAALAFWLMVAGIAGAAVSTNLYAIAQMFAGPRAAGSWIGVQNAVGNVSGIIGPIVTGLIIDRSGGYGWAFVVVAAVSALGALWWWLAIPEVRPIEAD